MARFDVAIPNYNYGQFLRACVISVLQQDVEGLRVLVIDNASTDDSLRVARELAAADPRVEIRAHPRNLGQHASFNAAVDWAEAEYFLILCSDDRLVPGALRRAAAVLDSDPSLAFCFGSDLPIGEAEPLVAAGLAGESPRWRRIRGRNLIEGACRQAVLQIAGPTVVIRTALHKRAGHYRSELPQTDDYELWMRLATLGDVALLDNVQAMQRTHAQNQSRQLAPAQIDHIRHFAAALESLFDHDDGRLEGPERLRRTARRALAARSYWAGLAALSRGEAGAGALFSYARSLRPSVLVAPPLEYLFRRADGWNRLRSALGALPVGKGSASRPASA